MVKTDSKPSTDTTDNTVFISVEQMPEFPGGKNAMMEYIQKKLVYPSAAVQNGVQGRVVVSFIIEKDGSISNTTVLKGVDSHLDKEALRIIKSMPKWKPAMQSGKYVRYKYTFPITFKLRK